MNRCKFARIAAALTLVNFDEEFAEASRTSDALPARKA